MLVPNRVVVALFSIAALVACSDSPNPFATRGQDTAHVPLPQTPDPTFDGNWIGTTQDSLPLSFSVGGDDTLANLSVAIKLTGNCGLAAVTLRVSGKAGGLLDQLIFVGDSTSAVSMRGQFTSYTTATGTVAANYTGTLSDGTPCRSTGSTIWSASKK